MRILVVVLISVLFAACQWVKPTDLGKEVALVKEIHVSNCEKLGSTESNVADNVGIIQRGDKKVAKELITLAKNQAAKMGGDTIVALSSAEDGSQNFGVFRCKN